MKVGTPEDDVAYLRSCRNDKALRSIVLAHLLASGSTINGAAPKSPAREGRRRDPKPIVGSTDAEWVRFRAALALSLAQLDVDQFLILEARRHPAYYVQFLQSGPAGVRGETVSNHFLKDFERLSSEDEGKLRELGWHPPADDAGDGTDRPDAVSEDGAPLNWHRAWTLPVPYGELARLAVATLRQVHEVSMPAYLAYNAFHRSGAPIILPNLGIVRSNPVDGSSKVEATVAPEPVTRDNLLEKVREVIAAHIGTNEVQVDSDGDIPLTNGVARLYVRVQTEVPVVTAFSPLVWDIGDPPDILQAVNEINRSTTFARALWDGKGVVAVAETLGHPFSPDALWACVLALTKLAEVNIPKLQERFGGTIPFGPALPAKTQSSLGYL
jgi:hypothetical protein